VGLFFALPPAQRRVLITGELPRRPVQTRKRRPPTNERQPNPAGVLPNCRGFPKAQTQKNRRSAGPRRKPALTPRAPRLTLVFPPNSKEFPGAIGFDVGTDELSACGRAWTT
jgi:hypothetical protein